MQKVINDILLNYEVLGQTRSRDLIILHGWGRSLDEWLPLATALAQKYRVILIDLPGFGASILPAGKTLDTYSYARTLEALLKDIGVKRATVIGHSFGGKIALLLAANTKLVSKLFLIDASGISPSSIKARFFRKLNPLRPLLPEFMGNLLASVLESRDYKEAGTLKKSFSRIVSQNLEREASRIKAPTVVIWGENDKEVPLSSGKKLHELISNSILRIAWEAGHNPHLEQPESFQNLINEYL